MAVNKFMVKKAELELLEQMYNILEREKEDVAQMWGDLDEMEQATKYNRETGKSEPLFDDNGEPVMRPKRGMIQKPDDEYTDSDRAKLKAIENLIKKLEGMM